MNVIYLFHETMNTTDTSCQSFWTADWLLKSSAGDAEVEIKSRRAVEETSIGQNLPSYFYTWRLNRYDIATRKQTLYWRHFIERRQKVEQIVKAEWFSYACAANAER